MSDTELSPDDGRLELEYTDEYLLEEIKRVADELGRAPIMREFGEMADPSSETVALRFGRWSNGLIEAGFEPNNAWSAKDVPGQQERLGRVGELKEEARCERCGGNFPSVAMDFHHEDPAEKVGGVSWMARHYSWERVQEEIEKCMLLCANCHRIVENKHE